MWLAQPAILERLRFVPSLPAWFRRTYAPRVGWWPIPEVRVPAQLRGNPGINRDSAAEQIAFEAEPLHDLRRVHPRLAPYVLQHMWDVSLRISPRLHRASRRSAATFKVIPAQSANRSLDPTDLTSMVRGEAKRLGLSSIGIAEYDDRYTYAEHRDECAQMGNRVLVCVLEQNYDSTQAIPSSRAEMSALSANAEVMKLGAQLAEYLHRLGFRAGSDLLGGHRITLQYAVASGLGQLGLNGQLLTPVAGSRCRLTCVQTDAPLLLDHPVDYGVPKLCDACKVCIRRCPVGAIPATRSLYRGVEKSKINTARCWPVVAQAHGCAICMKVCPVQKYGLQPVLDEFAKSGTVLGKNSDELEGFTWIDGAHYGPGERPRLSTAFTKPADFPLAEMTAKRQP